ncbi:MAG: type I secretion protein TolC [Limnohabitans sp.]|nr:MAG: type I secretion protein TolC [Limnohabitans sp.]
MLWMVLVPSAYSQSLATTYQKAKTQDAQYLAAHNAFLAAMEKLPQARSGLLPAVSLTANKNRQFGEASFAGASAVDRDVQSWSWTAQLTQPLFRWASWVGYQQADAATQQAVAHWAAAEQDLVVRVVQAYLDVWVAAQGVELMQSQLHALNEQLVLAQKTYEVGTGTITDVHEARAKWAQSQAQSVAASNELEIKQAELEKIAGEPITVGLSSGQVAPAPDTLEPLAQWLSRAEMQSPQIRAQLAALEVARKEVAKNQAAHLPTLDLVLSRATTDSSGSLSSPADMSTHVNSSQAGLQLTIPLYSGGGTQSRVREALALVGKVQDELTHTRRTIASQVRQAYVGILNGQAQVAALQSAIDAGRNAVESNKIGLRIGTRITPDVLNAEQQLYASLRDLSRVQAEIAIQYFKLRAATGSLTSDALMALDAMVLSAAETSSKE